MQAFGDKPSYVSSGMAPMLCTVIPTLRDNILTLTPANGEPMQVDIEKAMKGPIQEFV